MKRFAAVLITVLLILASGCNLSPVPSGSAASSVSPTATSPVSTPLPEDSAKASGTPQSSPAETETEPPAATSTPAPAATPTATKDTSSTNGMIFPTSGDELLMWKDLIALDAKKLDLARNEIFARRGYKFSKQSYTDYFSKFSWYTVDEDFKQSDFSETEAANVHLIQAAEKAINGLLFEVTSGLKLDYDQDGDLETLIFNLTDEAHMKVNLKDSGANTVWNIDGVSLIGKIYLGDISFTDSILDIFIGDAGYSDDYAAYVTGIKHKAFLKRGLIPGTITSDRFKPNGKGQISTMQRIDTVGTDFFIVRYKLNASGKLVFSPLASYNFISFSANQYTVTTKVDLTLKKKNTSSSEAAFTIPAGTKVTLLSTDTKKWVKIKAPAGEAWLELAEPLMVKDPNINTWDAFDGLLMAG